MEIMKGNQKLKESTLQDFIESKKDKPKQFSFVTAKEEANYNWDERENILKNLNDEVKEKQTYNETIRELDPMYANLKPTDSYILRLYVKEAVQTESGLLIKPEERVQSVRQGSNTPGELIVNPYDFDSLAVIVACPPYEQNLKPGTLVQVIRPKAEVLGQEVVGYEYGYAHPSYRLGQLPKSCKDRNFGYCLMPYNRIKIIVDEQV